MPRFVWNPDIEINLVEVGLWLALWAAATIAVAEAYHERSPLRAWVAPQVDRCCDALDDLARWR